VAAILSTVRASIAADMGTGWSISCLTGSGPQQASTSVSHSTEVQEAALTYGSLPLALSGGGTLIVPVLRESLEGLVLVSHLVHIFLYEARSR
jgi:hypothetical protein